MDSVLLEIEGLPEKAFRRGAVVLKEGKIGSKVYVLKEGAVSVYTAGSQICKINSPGTIFGEISALLSADYSATVVTEDDTVFYVIEDLPKLLDENPKICTTIARILALRVINMNSLYAELKQEFGKMRAVPVATQASQKIYDLLGEMDEFWGRNVFDPMGKKGIQPY